MAVESWDIIVFSSAATDNAPLNNLHPKLGQVPQKSVGHTKKEHMNMPAGLIENERQWHGVMDGDEMKAIL